MNSLFKRLLLGLALAIACYAVFIIVVGIGDLAGRLASFRFWLIVPVLLLTLGNYALRYCKWSMYLRVLGLAVPRDQNVIIFLGGLSMTITPGKIGELLKSYLLRSACGTPITRSAPIVLAERITDLIGLLLLMACGVLAFRLGVTLLVCLAIPVVILTVVIGSPTLTGRVTGWIERRRGLKNIGVKLSEAHQSATEIFRPRPLAISIVLSVAAWLCECIGFAIVLGGFPETNVSLLLATFIYSFTTLGGLPMPGGLGLTEGLMTTLLRLSGNLAQSTAAAATLIIRLCTLWFAVVLGSLALVIFRRKIGLVDALPEKI